MSDVPWDPFRDWHSLIHSHLEDVVSHFSLAIVAMVPLVFAGCDASLPSLKLGFDIKRPSMTVRSTTTFDVFVTPVVSGNAVSFNGKVTVKQEGATHNFFLVDGVPYHEVSDGTTSTTTCQSAAYIPSVSAVVDVVDAISSATAISSVNTDQDISCYNGTWLSTTFGGEMYALCVGANVDEDNFLAYGADLSVSFEYLSTGVVIRKPPDAPSNCNDVTDGSVVLSSLDTIYGKTLVEAHRKLKEEVGSAHLASPTCTYQSKPRPCLVFHGMDVKEDGGIVDDSSFFGDIKEHAPCCTSFNFAVLNTVDSAWYNDTLQQKACDAAMNVTTGRTDSGLTEINDLIVVAHSMGNSMLW